MVELNSFFRLLILILSWIDRDTYTFVYVSLAKGLKYSKAAVEMIFPI